MFARTYTGRRVLLTGHTGFKGSWLALWLTELGAQVHGLSLAPATEPSHARLLSLPLEQTLADVRDADAVRDVVAQVRPEIVFHLAAQSLVRPSYSDPLGTWSTNVMGTAHVLDACRHVGDVRAAVIVTTDKCYDNSETLRPYREDDPLGGHDPYSASKAGAELVAQSYRRAFFDPGGPLVATGRAGNVIGGGDWSQDRLLPDAARAEETGAVLEIRSPAAVRPWQHVLDSLSGYLLVGQRLLEGDAAAARAWNFGPRAHDTCTVEEMLRALREHWPDLRWQVSADPQPHEARLLRLDTTRAERELQWTPVWGLRDTISATAAWYRGWSRSSAVSTREDLARYTRAARASGRAWAQD